MKLKDLLQGIQINSVQADAGCEIRGVSCHSHDTEPGDVFIAVPGTSLDGNQFITEAFEKGAVCAVCQSPPRCGIPYVVVPCARRALALIAANWFGHPADEMTLIGVTGTNGKTTTTWLIKHVLEQKAGAKVGLIGTVENLVGDDVLPTERTTPPSYELQRLLRQMADAGCTHVVMEVSSHALALERIYGLHFDVGLFTNLTQDHLDFHGTMERYCAAKGRLMRSCSVAIYNADDPWSRSVLHGSTCPRISYGLQAECDLQAKHIVYQPRSVSYMACTAWGEIPAGCAIPGSFSVYNSLAAMAVCSHLGIPLPDCAQVLQCSAGARGRMEVLPAPGRDYTVLIDYAHTPDALENVLKTVRGFAAGRIIAVFGCGGDRDRTKRPQMGEIAAKLADIAVVTSDNPRTEDPHEIIGEILTGMSDPAETVVIENRIEAIGWALRQAQRGDVVVLCGKGHETYQEIRSEKYHLDEREIVSEYMKNHS